MFTFEKDLATFNDYGFRKYNSAVGAVNRYYKYNNWQKIDLPHDWAVSLQKTLDANVFQGGFPNTHSDRYRTMGNSNAKDICSVGWYRKEFSLGKEYSGKEKPVTKEYKATARCAENYEYIEFERLGGKTEVFLNGEKLGDNFTHLMPRSSSDNTNRPYRFYCDFAEVKVEAKIVE